jgi:nitrous oxidase accessory protein NosD
MSFTVPFVSVMAALVDFVVSATEVAFSVTAAFDGTVLGGVYAVGAPLAVVAGLTVPHAGEQAVPFCVKVQLNP